MKRRHGKLTNVADVVTRVLHAGGPDRQRSFGTTALRVFGAFARIGPPIVEHAEPVLYRRGVLTLQVAESAWMTELSFLAHKIRDRMNTILGRDIIKEVRFRLGPLERPPPVVLRPRPIPQATKDRIAEWATHIGNEEVRDAVVRAAERFAAMPPKKWVDVSGPPGPRTTPPETPPAEPEPMRYGYGDKPRDRWKNNKPKW